MQQVYTHTECIQTVVVTVCVLLGGVPSGPKSSALRRWMQVVSGLSFHESPDGKRVAAGEDSFLDETFRRRDRSKHVWEGLT